MKLPSSLIARAEEVSVTLSSLAEDSHRRSKGARLATRRRELLRVRFTPRNLWSEQTC